MTEMSRLRSASLDMTGLRLYCPPTYLARRRVLGSFLPRTGDRRDTIKDCVENVVTMPKLKSRKAAAKRFRRSGSGKIMRRKAFKNHLLQHKNANRRSRLSKIAVVSEEDAPNVELMLPYL